MSVLYNSRNINAVLLMPLKQVLQVPKGPRGPCCILIRHCSAILEMWGEDSPRQYNISSFGHQWSCFCVSWVIAGSAFSIDLFAAYGATMGSEQVQPPFFCPQLFAYKPLHVDSLSYAYQLKALEIWGVNCSINFLNIYVYLFSKYFTEFHFYAMSFSFMSRHICLWIYMFWLN